MRSADTEDREDRIRRLMQAMGENTKSGAIDIACKHYLADLERKRKHIHEIPDDLIDELSTPYLPLEREITNHGAGLTTDATEKLVMNTHII